MKHILMVFSGVCYVTNEIKSNGAPQHNTNEKFTSQLQAMHICEYVTIFIYLMYVFSFRAF